MTRAKAFIGTRLRRLRRERKETQAEMARRLGVSPAYVNLLENNQRSLSVQVLFRLAEAYGVDWRGMLDGEAPTQLADLRAVFDDPLLVDARPDLTELRAALVHAPTLSAGLLRLYRSHAALADRLMALGAQEEAGATRPEQAVHDLFRRHRNHFAELEAAAEALPAVPPDELYGALKARLRRRLIAVETVPADTLPGTLRDFDEGARIVRLSEALDHPNRVFQLAHVVGLLEAGHVIDGVIARAGIAGPREMARCRAELANYVAAAVMMPYAPFLALAREGAYDLDRLVHRFGASFEQVCHRVTTLQRDGAQGVPLFFLRIDKAGNVSKRFNATTFQLADYGGACPRWDVHLSFRMPGRILPQVVEMPDGARFFTVSRSVDRPILGGGRIEDNRLAVTLGCALEDAGAIGYAAQFRLTDPGLATPIGINCRLCPRTQCSQRAHQPLHMDLSVDVRRRGPTRFES